MTDLTTAPPANWDLERVFPGKTQSPALAAFLDDVSRDLTALLNSDLPASLTTATRADWVSMISQVYGLLERLTHAGSYIHCLASEDTSNTAALQLLARIDQMRGQVDMLFTKLSSHMAQQPDDEWAALLQVDALAPIAFGLDETRDEARRKLAVEFESLIDELSVNGYHAWNRVYDQTAARAIEFEGEKKTPYQLQITFTSHAERAMRQKAFDTFETAWADRAEVCAQALNYQAGFRLSLYNRRGWDSILTEPLFNNRLTQATVDAMWQAIEAGSSKLGDYFAAKARLLGVDKLTWYDLGAPLGSNDLTYTFAEAGDFVVNSINAVDPAIAEFCRHAIDQQWIEAEDRSGKRAGAYCTGLPLLKESRIFMTFNGSYDTLSTLAHELGHGYHNWAMRQLPYGARFYGMAVAETASTMNEAIVLDASLKAAASQHVRLNLLNEKLSTAVSFLMNIYCRYLFELSFFEARRERFVNVAELNELMLAAQKRAHHNLLADDGYHPLFWASKLHFYITRAPFYNFPYTFGYLFSLGVYDYALKQGNDFSAQYAALLRDTGSMTTEALAQKHLGVDLTQPAFWQAAVDRALADVDDFVALSNALMN